MQTSLFTSLLFVFGYRVKQYRIEKNLSLEELSAISAIDIVKLTGIEKGSIDSTLNELVSISAALEVSLYELFNDIESNLYFRN
jgi:transcriptional regulator with XRE-family HTH domain